MLAGGPAGAPLRSCAVQQIVDATSAILAEVKAAGGGMLTAAVGRGSRGSLPLLAARLTRLENAAHQMVDSAQSGDAVALRGQIARFDVLTAAMWTVHLSEYPRNPRTPGAASGHGGGQLAPASVAPAARGPARAAQPLPREGNRAKFAARR
jgi:hypothetical protein